MQILKPTLLACLALLKKMWRWGNTFWTDTLGATRLVQHSWSDALGRTLPDTSAGMPLKTVLEPHYRNDILCMNDTLDLEHDRFGGPLEWHSWTLGYNNLETWDDGFLHHTGIVYIYYIWRCPGQASCYTKRANVHDVHLQFHPTRNVTNVFGVPLVPSQKSASPTQWRLVRPMHFSITWWKMRQGLFRHATCTDAICSKCVGCHITCDAR